MFSGSQGDDENVIHRFSKQFSPSLSTIFEFPICIKSIITCKGLSRQCLQP